MNVLYEKKHSFVIVKSEYSLIKRVIALSFLFTYLKVETGYGYPGNCSRVLGC